MEVEVQTNGFKVHASHTCDGCSVSPIVGKRFKSSVTAKYNLCSKCFAAYDGDDLFEETLLDRDRKSTKEYVLKIKTNDGPEFTQIRRINVADVWGEDDELSYTKLIAAASKLASIQSGDSTKAKVTYMDGDGDRITISSDVELTDSFRQSIKPRKPFCVTVLFPEENEVKATSAMGIVKNPQKVDNVNLPWSCAIYSVVNWMVAFQDVEGIQIMCLKTLPYLLEDEQQRTTAQRAGLTDNVLHAMVLFPDSIELHTVAFHTLVLLARPLGGNEGMLFHTAMVNTRGIFSNDSTNSKNGIVIMLDSMRRFAQDEILQAMSCWSLVNVALTPLQKSILVKLGGLTVTANAMLQHPYNAEVQFRALFALINLVIPTEPRGPEETEQMREKEREIFQQLGEAGETTEREMLDASVGQITNLVVVAMKNFCSSEAILNRACLVLHNLSFDEAYHGTLLWTPNCYQMLEWCIGNYPHDHVLQQSAGRTLQRLNATLSANEELRVGFTYSELARQPGSCVSTRAAF